MARTTVGKLVTKTAGAAAKAGVGVAKRAVPGKKGAAATEQGAAASTARGSGEKKRVDKGAPVKKGTAVKKAAGSAAQASAKAPAKKAPAKAANKPPAKAVKKAPAKAKKAPAKAGPAQKAPAQKAPAKKAPAKAAKKAPPTMRPLAGGSAELAVKAGEKPWTDAELHEVTAELTADAERLQDELNLAERELDDLMRDAGDGAGNDQADIGSTTFERDHEMSLANNARVMLTQTQHALERIKDGTYGLCESCGQPIGKNRLMAFPRATLCLTCKQREERR